MKKIRALFTLLLMAVAAGSALAAETTIKGTVFATWMMNLADGADNYNAFSIDRAYFGAESKLSEYTSLRITFDIRPDKLSSKKTAVTDSDGDTVNVPAMSVYDGYPIILKFAYADWKVKPIADLFKVRFGLQPTMFLWYIDGIWERRYISQNVIDLNGWLSTADLGLSAYLSLGHQGSFGEAGLSILNGTKFSDITDKNKNKDINLFAKITPFADGADFSGTTLLAQAYFGTQNKEFNDTISSSDWKNQIISLGGKLAWRKTADVCFDVNFRSFGQGAGQSDLKQSAFSFWGNLYVSQLVPSTSPFKTLALFGRVDLSDPNTDLSQDGATMVLAGVECSPVKGVRASLDFRSTSYQDDDMASLKYVFLNSEFKF